MDSYDIGPGVFLNAKNETMIFVAENEQYDKNCESQTHVLVTDAKTFPKATLSFSINQRLWIDEKSNSIQVYTTPEELLLLKKITSIGKSLGDICKINQGLRTGDNEKYISNTKLTGKWEKVVGGNGVGRYTPLIVEKYVLYDEKKLDAPRRREIFNSNEKLVVQEIRNIKLKRRVIATYDNNHFFCLQSTNVINLKPECEGQYSIKTLLAILNCNLINFFFRNKFSGNNHIASNQLSQIPIRDLSHDENDALSTLIDQILQGNKNFLLSKSEADKSLYKKHIDTLDNEINSYINRKYKLNEDEIEIINKYA